MRNFLSGGLKDTSEHLEKAVLTGIMRVAKESIFSGLNNLGIFTLLSQEFEDKFGFTDNEVKQLAADFNFNDQMKLIRKWYNGYIFGKTVIYNPWSILCYAASKGRDLKPYWVNTSDNKIIETLLTSSGKELKEELELLIQGESIEKPIEENIILKDVEIKEDILWSFLLMGGYLKYEGMHRDTSSEKLYCALSIPNREVRSIYTRIVDNFFTDKIENKKVEIMLKALLDGDIKLFEEILQDNIIKIFSYHDLSGEPEKFYHAFVAGLLIWISDSYEIKSNRESGYGRYDIMIIPKNVSKPGFVIEFKKLRQKETVKSATESALKQIEEKKYETELMERGIKDIIKLAIVFEGKCAFVTEG